MSVIAIGAAVKVFGVSSNTRLGEKAESHRLWYCVTE